MIGPSEENLRRLAGMLPSMAEGVKNGEIGGRGQSIIRTKKYMCPACMKMWGQQAPVGAIVKSNVCKACKWELKGGATIFICDDQRYVIMKPKPGAATQINPKFVGKIVKVPNEAMDTILGEKDKNDLTQN